MIRDDVKVCVLWRCADICISIMRVCYTLIAFGESENINKMKKEKKKNERYLMMLFDAY